MTSFYFLFQAFLYLLALSFFKFLKSSQIAELLALLLLCLICLFSVKRFYSSEKVLAVFLGLVLCLATVDVGLSTATHFSLINGFVYVLTISGLIVTSLKIRLAVLLLVFVNQALCFWFFFGTSVDGFLVFSVQEIGGIIFGAIVNVVGSFFLISIILKIKDIAQKDLDQEIEWQQRSIRLEELSEMTRTMRLLLERPVHTIQDNFEALERRFDKSAMNRVQGDLDELLLISQSFAWIYRAYGQEGSSAILSTAFIQQLQVLLSLKADEKGWTFAVKEGTQPIEIYGPIPSIILFLFTVIVQIMERSQRREKKQLSIEIDHADGMVCCKLRWRLGIQDSDALAYPPVKGEYPPDVARRQELIRDLSQTCNASIEQTQDKEANQILISGAWRRLEAQGNSR